MVKYCAIIVILLSVLACTEEQKNTAEQTAFNTESYKKNQYAERIFDFLTAQTETKSEQNYTAIFVNTSMCSVCTMGDFEEISPYLDKSDGKIFVFANDSSIVKGYNDRLKYIILEKEMYKSRQIFHEKIYLYRVFDQQIKAIPLVRETIDSLNATVK